MGNEVIQDVARDEDAWPPEAVVRRKQAAARALGITPRQYEVLLLVVEGLTSVEIGRRLFVTADTVNSHVKALRFALDARNRAHIVGNAFRRDLVY